MAPPFVSEIAQTARNGYNDARIGVHKWFARRPGALFRPLPVFVPCRRVVGAGGVLCGYGGGLEIKAALLRLEKAALER